MYNLLIAFVTGLTTGGLSCLAVQGGLLASSLAAQIEKDVQVSTTAPARKSKKSALPSDPARPQLALPILLFLTAKLAAYTILGFFLGYVGSVFQLSPLARAVLQFAIGIFMIGSALRMLNVHPIFRYFAFEPPAFLRKRIRRTASSNTSYLAPVFLGLLTILIPCGITQAMMAVAISTADPLGGAALMFAFTLGTSPVFFAVAYFATRLGAKLEKNFMRFAAIVVLVLGLLTIDTGLNLAGAPISITRTFNSLLPQTVSAEADPTPTNESNTGIVSALDALEPAGPEPTQAPEQPQAENVITIKVKNNGYEPSLVHAKAGAPLKLRLVTNKTYSCALAFVIPALDFSQVLEPTGEALVDIPAQEKGTRMPFSCSMGMYTGDIVFE